MGRDELDRTVNKRRCLGMRIYRAQWRTAEEFRDDLGVLCGRRPPGKKSVEMVIWSAAVMCPAFSCGFIAAGLDEIRGSGSKQSRVL
jgi:hypothetical protein